MTAPAALPQPPAVTALLAALGAEIGALEAGDPDAIEAATAAKLAALAALDPALPLARSDLEAARRLNDLAGARAQTLLARVRRRRDALDAARRLPPPLVYGRAGYAPA